MKYRIQHITEYLYSADVSHCYNLAHMIPRTTRRQKCSRSEVKVNPSTSFASKRQDYFGNTSYHFEIQRRHRELEIRVVSEVDTKAQYSEPQLDFGMTCSDALKLLQESKGSELLMAREFSLTSPMVRASDFLQEYAAPSFIDDKPLLSCVMDLTSRIYKEFKYCPESTTVATPLSEVMANKRGVCQDFAHLQIGCLRAMGFPAKYISGYIETLPPPGQEKLVGTDASHAWISVFSPGEGWVEFDPTNNCLAGEQHIITAWGRDYYDVTPLRGTIFGGGKRPVLNISVDVARI